MSTYTDVKNVMKETVNVVYDSRETNQQVKFLNINNVFTGTFHGELGNDVKLNDVALNKPVLVDAVASNLSVDGLIFDNCQQITDLSNMCLNAINSIDELATNTNANLSSITDDIIPNLSVDFTNELEKSISELSLSLTNEINEINTNYDTVRNYTDALNDLANSVSEMDSNLSTRMVTNDQRITNLYNRVTELSSNTGTLYRTLDLREIDHTDIADAKIDYLSSILSVDFVDMINSNTDLVNELSVKSELSVQALTGIINELNDHRAHIDAHLQSGINEISGMLGRVDQLSALGDFNEILTDLSTYTYNTISPELGEATNNLAELSTHIDNLQLSADNVVNIADELHRELHNLDQHYHHDLELYWTALSVVNDKIVNTKQDIYNSISALEDKENPTLEDVVNVLKNIKISFEA